MAFTTSAKDFINRTLSPLNVRVDTNTADRAEAARVTGLHGRGHFSRPAFPLLPQMAAVDLTPFFEGYRNHRQRLETVVNAEGNSVGYSNLNDYFRTPDAEALYLVAQTTRPRRWMEVGSGHSTRLLRQAIIDGRMDTEVIAVDPNPRVDVAEMVDTLHRCRLEELENNPFSELEAGDVLFIDSSHFARVGNDVVHLYMNVIPALRKGVLVHVHDVTLPYEYPLEWVELGLVWDEQYLLQCFLHGTDHEIVWPGYHLQRDRSDVVEKLPFLKQGRAQSFWFKI